MNNKAKQLSMIQNYIHNLFHRDVTGHDFFHMQRVAKMAKQIAIKEKANQFICEASGWLHDIGDRKLFIHPEKEYKKLFDFLKSIQVTKKEITQIDYCIKNVSFSQGKTPKTIEGKIVQDADRLDAIGAIGIARTFAFGGANDQLIYDDVNKMNTSIQHFYDKLLKLTELMNTETGRAIAIKRHVFMEEYLVHFFNEWNNTHLYK